MPDKTCTVCGRAKPWTLEFFRPNGPKYLRSECRECAGRKDQERYWSDPEKSRVSRNARRARSPERASEIRKRSYAKHAEKRRAEMRERYAKDPERFRRERIEAYRRDPEKFKEARRTWWRKLRAEMFAAYGSRCSCCGEAEQRFLTLEHVNRDGNEHRARMKGRASAISELRRLGWPRNGYTILCWNCQMASWIYGACPHNGPAADIPPLLAAEPGRDPP